MTAYHEPICSQSAPPSIIRLHSELSLPKSEARTEGETIAFGMFVEVEFVVLQQRQRLR